MDPQEETEKLVATAQDLEAAQKKGYTSGHGDGLLEGILITLFVYTLVVVPVIIAFSSSWRE